MAETKLQSQKPTIVDPVWRSICSDAEQMMANEPAFAGLVIANVLNHERVEEAIAYRASELLDHRDMPAAIIRRAFFDVLRDNPSIADNIRSDLMATLERDPACNRAIDPVLFFKGFQAIQTYRFSNALWKGGRKDFARYLQSRSSQVFQVDIHPAAVIGRGIMVDHATGLVIGETARVGDDVSILHAVTLGGTGKEDGDRHPKIGCGVMIGAGAKILGNISIGDCARIAAGSVVLKDVPAKTTVAGVPAKVVGEAGCAQPASRMDQMIVDDSGKTDSN
ncbi:serine O-acetyltransferase [Maritalea porphyrae]|jgi:serine O-acetyltransferase|uniref:serine O-acetyltransferase n=1 Tax=Maritalea porphyrae TaxID=880732 RepID=UPI0022B03C68|nr:serine O-acetyltransferase [Maritalea porphyrae]MCZ4272777.1 serine O-acetyltransferase [Maritalea porphyrae]